MCGSMGDVSMQIPSPESRLTTDEYLRAAPDAYGDIEVVDGLVVHNVAQSEVHDLVVRRLAAALENARPAGGPCFRVSSDVAVRFADAASSLADHRLNIRYPDIMVRDCDPTTPAPYETASSSWSRSHRRPPSRPTPPPSASCTRQPESPATSSYTSTRTGRGSARSKSTGSTGPRRYVVQDVHRRALILDEPFRLTATFDDLQRP